MPPLTSLALGAASPGGRPGANRFRWPLQLTNSCSLPAAGGS